MKKLKQLFLKSQITKITFQKTTLSQKFNFILKHLRITRLKKCQIVLEVSVRLVLLSQQHYSSNMPRTPSKTSSTLLKLNHPKFNLMLNMVHISVVISAKMMKI
jgi:hypothetical protein